MEFFWQAFVLWALTRGIASHGYHHVLAGIAASKHGAVKNLNLSWPNLGIQLIINTAVILLLAQLLEAIYG
jgi:hypothetical protein